jgi:hypothetical protein
MKSVAVVLAVVAAVVALLYSATLAGAESECEACVRYEGREGCRTATGGSREAAEQAAVMTACALVANGVTATIACQGLEPVKLACRAR